MVFDTGYMKGADLWHMATALFIALEPGELYFITLDKRQQAIASISGFRT